MKQGESIYVQHDAIPLFAQRIQQLTAPVVMIIGTWQLPVSTLDKSGRAKATWDLAFTKILLCERIRVIFMMNAIQYSVHHHKVRPWPYGVQWEPAAQHALEKAVDKGWPANRSTRLFISHLWHDRQAKSCQDAFGPQARS